MVSCTILILTYKGKHHLELLMPTVMTAIDQYTGSLNIDVMIVDNGCDETTHQFIQTHYSRCNYIFSTVNDYLFSLNVFIKNMSSDYVLMLNDDMKLEPQILNELIPLIEKDSDLFAVSCRIMDFDGVNTVSAVRQVKYSRGWMYHYYLDTAETGIKYTLYPGGGAAIFRTSYFNKLQGFDDLYRPAYSEDTDLGIRAWQEGWKVVYHPGAILYHREGGTINEQFKRDRIEQMMNRNHILWMVKNVRYPGFLFWFLLMLPFRILKTKRNNANLHAALISSLRFLPAVISKRLRNQQQRVSDKKWITCLNKKYAPIPCYAQ